MAKLHYLPVALLLPLCGVQAEAQSARTTQGVTTAYGARLTTSAGSTQRLNTRRYNNRIANRINNRVLMRVERFSVSPGITFSTTARTQGSQSAAQAYQSADAAGRQNGLVLGQTIQTQPNPYQTNNEQDDPRGRALGPVIPHQTP